MLLLRVKKKNNKEKRTFKKLCHEIKKSQELEMECNTDSQNFNN